MSGVVIPARTEEPLAFSLNTKKQRSAWDYFRRRKRTVESGVRRGCAEVSARWAETAS